MRKVVRPLLARRMAFCISSSVRESMAEVESSSIEYPRVDQEGPRDGDALLLASGEGDSALADLGIVALVEAHDEVVGLGGLGRLDDIGPSAASTPKPMFSAIERENRNTSCSMLAT